MNKLNLKEMSKEELQELLGAIQEELTARNKKESEVVELFYNRYKGSGKCWIATVDPETKKITGFLDAESVQKRDNYSGSKIFRVPLTEGQTYLFCQSGSKSTDSRSYKKVVNGELVDL